MLQLRLEADHVVERAQRIVLAQLHDRIGLDRRVMRVGEADRLHRSVPQRLGTALGHDLDGQAAVEIGCAFPLLELGLLAIHQRRDEGLVLVLVHRAVDVVLAVASRPDLVVARLEPGDVHIDRLDMHDRRDCVEEGEGVRAGRLRRSTARATAPSAGRWRRWPDPTRLEAVPALRRARCGSAGAPRCARSLPARSRRDRRRARRRPAPDGHRRRDMISDPARRISA